MKEFFVPFCQECDQTMTEYVYYVPILYEYICEECLMNLYAKEFNQFPNQYEDLEDFIKKKEIIQIPLDSYIDNHCPDNEDQIFESERENF